MDLKKYIQLILFAYCFGNLVAFFNGEAFRIGRCFVNGDGEVHVSFKTSYKYENLITTFCGGTFENCIQQGINHSSADNCTITEDSTVTCKVIDYIDYIALKARHIKIIKSLLIFGQNNSGVFFLSNGTIRTWNFCLLRICEQTIPLVQLDKNSINVNSDKIDISFTSGTIQDEPEVLKPRILNVILKNMDRNTSTVVVSKHFMGNNYPYRIKENITNTCGNYNNICISNGFNYCSDENNTIKMHFTNPQCEKIKPYYILPDIDDKVQCSSDERSIDITMNIINSPDYQASPVFFLFNIKKEGENSTQFKTYNNNTFYTFRNLMDAKRYMLNVSLCNDCSCSPPTKLDCQRPSPNPQEKSNLILTIVIILSVIIFLFFGSVAVSYIIRKMKTEKLDKERRVSLIDAPLGTPFYCDIFDKPYGYDNIELANVKNKSIGSESENSPTDETKDKDKHFSSENHPDIPSVLPGVPTMFNGIGCNSVL